MRLELGTLLTSIQCLHSDYWPGCYRDVTLTERNLLSYKRSLSYYVLHSWVENDRKRLNKIKIGKAEKLHSQVTYVMMCKSHKLSVSKTICIANGQHKLRKKVNINSTNAFYQLVCKWEALRIHCFKLFLYTPHELKGILNTWKRNIKVKTEQNSFEWRRRKANEFSLFLSCCQGQFLVKWHVTSNKEIRC